MVLSQEIFNKINPIYSSNTTILLTDSNESEGVGSYIDITTSKSGIGILIFGNGVGYAIFMFSTDGIVTFIINSANVFSTIQTDTNHVIIKDNGSNVRITNELGSTIAFTLIINYTN